MISNKLRLWEAAALFALGLTLMAGAWSSASADALAGQVLRLHVIANSDAQADQELKLQVRDGVLAQAGELLEGISSQEEAEAVLTDHLEELARTGADIVGQAGYDYPVSASLEECWFPTRVYDGVTLEAGIYDALIVELGTGEGDNWWCVIYPPLCFTAANGDVEYRSLIYDIIEKFFNR